MKKKIATFFMAMSMVVSSFSGTIVSADTTANAIVSVTKAEQLENKSVHFTGKVENPVENQEITIVAAKIVDGKVDTENYIYVDQQNSIVNSDGTFEMTFNPKASLDENSKYVVKVGGTGIVNSANMIVSMGSSGEVTDVYVGDADGNGTIAINDASLVLQYVLNAGNTLKDYKDDSNFVDRMDVFGNKIITAQNASAILQKVLDGTFEFVRKDNQSSEDTTKKEDSTESTTQKEDNTENTTKKEDNTESTTSSQGGGSEDTTTEATTEATDVVFEGDMLVNADLTESIPEAKMYKTVCEAVAAIDDKTPTESDRVVIDIMPGVYREQVYLSTPYVELRKNPNYDGEVKLTWYYGTGSMYDSVATDGPLKGYYDPNAIGDGKVGIPLDWGPALKVAKTATGTIVRDITFENSYNQYYTEEELNDELTVNPDTNNSMFDRGAWIKEQIANGKSDEYINKWLQSRTNLFSYINSSGETKLGSPRERAAAFHCSADKFEAYNCKFISKQDTMGINSGREYYENCLLAGTVDYICGSATAVFNNCELKFDAGPDMHTDELSLDKKATSDSGHVTAPANDVGSKGYLFYKCKITGSDTAAQGTLGRPWGKPGGPEAIYYNTTIGKTKDGKSLITDAGWADMSDTKKDKARFYEYGSRDEDGKPIDTSKRVLNSVAPMGTVINKWQILEFNPYNYTKGDDGWDPMNMKGNYTEFDDVLSGITFDENVTGDISLPTPADGYEYYWESDTDFAVVDNDTQKIAVTRPAYGSDAITANLTIYIHKLDTEYGVKGSVKLNILPNETKENTFNVSGKVSLAKAADKDVEVKVEAIQNGATVASQNVTIETGATEKDYTVNYLPAGEYTVKASAVTSGYRVTVPAEGTTTVSGVSGDAKELNIEVKQLKKVTLSTSDFSESWAIPTPTVVDSNATAEVVTGTSSDTANIGIGNKALKFTKADGKTVKNTVGFYFDFAEAAKDNGGTLANTDTLKFSYDLLLEKDKLDPTVTDGNGYMAKEYSFIDFTTKLKDGSDSANPSRFARYGIHKKWNQLNFFTATGVRVNGDNTQFEKNSTMRNKWYHIVTDVDLKAQTVYVSVYDRESGTIINKKAFTIAAPAVDGTNTGYPTELVSDALFAAIYLDKDGSTTNKIEFYMDNIELTYMDFK